MATGRRRPLEPDRDRAIRPPIEAERVDESVVVVRPTDLKADAPDDEPTVAAFEPPTAPNATSIALSRESTPPPSDAIATQRKDPMRGPRSSAAVARRTFDAAPGRSTSNHPASTVQVRMSGPGLGPDTGTLIKRRLTVLLAGGLASAAIGLMFGRMRQAPSSDETPLEPAAARDAFPQIQARAPASSAVEEPPLVLPRTARELLLDANDARMAAEYEDATRLYERAVEVLPPTHPMAASARLGRADALQQLGRRPEALAELRAVVRQFAGTPEAAQAAAALRDDEGSRTAIAKGPGRSASSNQAKDLDTTSAPRPGMPRLGDRSSERAPPDLDPPATCRWILTRYLDDPRAAVAALEELRDDHPTEPCVHWNLGRKHEALAQHRAAMVAYQRFLTLDPDSPRAPAVRRKLRSLEDKARPEQDRP